MKQLLKLTGCLAVAGLFALVNRLSKKADYQIIPIASGNCNSLGKPLHSEE